MIAESLLSFVTGGLMRLAPEVLKAFDRKNERGHELALLKLEMEFAGVAGEEELNEA